MGEGSAPQRKVQGLKRRALTVALPVSSVTLFAELTGQRAQQPPTGPVERLTARHTLPARRAHERPHTAPLRPPRAPGAPRSLRRRPRPVRAHRLHHRRLRLPHPATTDRWNPEEVAALRHLRRGRDRRTIQRRRRPGLRRRIRYRRPHRELPRPEQPGHRRGVAAPRTHPLAVDDRRIPGPFPADRAIVLCLIDHRFPRSSRARASVTHLLNVSP